MTDTQNIFLWLEANGYQDVAKQINTQKQKWVAQGLKTRRNWWEVLSGDKNGKPRVIDGVAFPVLATAQERQGKAVTDNALKLNDGEAIPAIKENHRWTKRDADADTTAAPATPPQPVDAPAQEATAST